MKAKNAVAEAFQAKVADEILPAVRKHGAYMTTEVIEKTLSDPDFIIGLATALKEEKQKRMAAEAEIQVMQPKALFADSVSASSTTILVADLAKLLKQNGIDTGEKRLYAWLRENGYLIKRKCADYNMPAQRSMDLGLFEINESTINRPDKEPIIRKTTRVTGKGQQYFIDKFIKHLASEF
ncbi:Phage antirepressor protein YoqD, KilAC domain [Anaerovirgula multivorans]|uniref:Phage antirepressor protein YoqD, KilAC domain n=1 Tax=Anaerovirgula multivorans TaxID=312168 RepID=A0A239CQQ3_9FIRM|nr:phage antirepressor KilAC domain-containing protein [Anaerovirgula multivorans]SNS22437.1 Phage antirepressor protein YoqD, KilAC domain [Anaerovirgula multivorans]